MSKKELPNIVKLPSLSIIELEVKFSDTNLNISEAKGSTTTLTSYVLIQNVTATDMAAGFAAADASPENQNAGQERLTNEFNKKKSGLTKQLSIYSKAVEEQKQKLNDFEGTIKALKDDLTPKLTTPEAMTAKQVGEFIEKIQEKLSTGIAPTLTLAQQIKDLAEKYLEGLVEQQNAFTDLVQNRVPLTFSEPVSAVNLEEIKNAILTRIIQSFSKFQTKNLEIPMVTYTLYTLKNGLFHDKKLTFSQMELVGIIKDRVNSFGSATLPFYFIEGELKIKINVGDSTTEKTLSIPFPAVTAENYDKYVQVSSENKALPIKALPYRSETSSPSLDFLIQPFNKVGQTIILETDTLIFTPIYKQGGDFLMARKATVEKYHARRKKNAFLFPADKAVKNPNASNGTLEPHVTIDNL